MSFLMKILIIFAKNFQKSVFSTRNFDCELTLFMKKIRCWLLVRYFCVWLFYPLNIKSIVSLSAFF